MAHRFTHKVPHTLPENGIILTHIHISTDSPTRIQLTHIQVNVSDTQLYDAHVILQWFELNLITHTHRQTHTHTHTHSVRENYITTKTKRTTKMKIRKQGKGKSVTKYEILLSLYTNTTMLITCRKQVSRKIDHGRRSIGESYQNIGRNYIHTQRLL